MWIALPSVNKWIYKQITKWVQNIGTSTPLQIRCSRQFMVSPSLRNSTAIDAHFLSHLITIQEKQYLKNNYAVSSHHIHQVQTHLPDNTNYAQFAKWLKEQPQFMKYVSGSVSPWWYHQQNTFAHSDCQEMDDSENKCSHPHRSLNGMEVQISDNHLIRTLSRLG